MQLFINTNILVSLEYNKFNYKKKKKITVEEIAIFRYYIYFIYKQQCSLNYYIHKNNASKH